MKVLSIDPGFGRVGIAVLEKKNGSKEEILFSECFETSSSYNFNKRLILIGEEINKIISKFNPNAVAIEKLFFNTNQKTAINVAQIYGMIQYIALSNEIKFYEYTPLQVKVAITGNGRATKKDVFFMLKRLVKIEKKKAIDDEYDAIAVGITFFAIEKSI